MGTTFSCMVVVETIICLSTKTNSPNFIFVNCNVSTISKNELKNHLTFSKNFSGRLVKAAFFCVQRNNLTEYKVFIKKNYLFSDSEWPTWRLSGKTFQQVVKMEVYVSRRTFWGFISSPWANVLQNLFWKLRKNVGFPVKIFDMIVKTALHFSKWFSVEIVYFLLSEIVCFLQNLNKIFQLCREEFQQVR